MNNPYVPMLVPVGHRRRLRGLLGRRRRRSPGPSATTAPSWTPTSAASSRPRRRSAAAAFPVKYYLTAMLFIIFDIEIVFLYPFAVAFNQLGLFGLVEMVLFIVTVFVAYAYVWRRGGLEWD